MLYGRAETGRLIFGVIAAPDGREIVVQESNRPHDAPHVWVMAPHQHGQNAETEGWELCVGCAEKLASALQAFVYESKAGWLLPARAGGEGSHAEAGQGVGHPHGQG